MKTRFILLLVLLSSYLFAQDNYVDVVYLKNGSVIRGIITEQIPNKSIKIITKDQNVFVFKIEEVEKITKEKMTETATPQKESVNYKTNETIPQKPSEPIKLLDADSYWGITFAPSVPVGDFSASNLSTTDAYPLSGGNLGIKGSSNLYSILSLGYRIDANIEPVDFNSFKKKLQNEIDGQYPFLQYPYSNLIVSDVKGDPWMIGNIQVGPAISFKFNQRISLDFDFLLGIIFANKPYSAYTVTYTDLMTNEVNPFSRTTNKNSFRIGLGYSFDMGIKINTSSNFGVKFGCNFSGSSNLNFNYESSTTYSNQIAPQSSKILNSSHSIAITSPYIGIIFLIPSSKN